MRGFRRPWLLRPRRFEGKTTPNPNPYSSPIPSPILTLIQPAPTCRICPVFYHWQLMQKQVNQHTVEISGLKSRLGALEEPTVRKKLQSFVISKMESGMFDVLVSKMESLLLAFLAFFGLEYALSRLVATAKKFISDLQKKSTEEIANLKGQLIEMKKQYDEMQKKGNDN